MTRGRPPSPETAYRLRIWQAGCERGLSSQEIADQLGIKLATLQQTVHRARQKGDPRAVYHPAARFAGDGIAFLVRANTRASRARRRRREKARRDTLRKAHHRNDNTE